MNARGEEESSDRDSSPEWHDIGEEVKRKNKPLSAHFHYAAAHDWTVGDNVEQSEWASLPELIMERIFAHLNISDRYSASMVCKQWNSAFYLPYVWHIFKFGEQTLTRRRFNYYSGWQHTLDHLRAQLCLGTVGRHFRVLIFTPMTNFYNMYEFMNMISFYAEQQDLDTCPVRGISRNIKTLKYVFPCKYLSGEEDQESQQQHTLYGTGGKLLDAVKRLMGNLRNLTRLELTDLMLDNYEAMTLLDDVCCECCQTLRFLSLMNFTKGQYHLLHVGVFINLQVLIIGPHNLGEEIIELLSHTKLRHLHIAQTGLTPASAKSLSPKCWKDALRKNQPFRVHLSLETKTEKSLLWQEGAPVHSILVDSPVCEVRMIDPANLRMKDEGKDRGEGCSSIGEFQQIDQESITDRTVHSTDNHWLSLPYVFASFQERENELDSDVIVRSCQFYSRSLSYFGYRGLLKHNLSTPFNSRMDAFFVMLVNECQKIHTLIIRDHVATSTLLLIADQCKSLKRYHVRRKAVIPRFDWPRNPLWDDKYFDWLENASQSIEDTENEISRILGFKWKMLTDKEFIRSDISMY